MEKPVNETSMKPTRTSLFVFTKKKDLPLLFIATSAVIISCVAPAMSTIVFGNVFTKLTKFLSGGYSSSSDFMTAIRIDVGLLIGMGFGKMIFNWLGIYFWMKFGEIQLIRARTKLYKNTFKIDHEWFENKSNLMGEISQINRCIEEFRDGTAGAVGSLISTVASIIAMLVTAFIQSWSLTLVILSSTPLMVLFAWYFGIKTFNAAELENDFSAKSSKIVDWNLVSGTTVRQFNGKYIEIVKFNRFADLTRKAHNILINAVAINTSMLKFLAMMTFVQAFWFGNHMISINKLKINQVFTCFSACMMLGSEVALVTDILAFMNKSYAAISKICNLIDETRLSEDSNNKYCPSTATGLIEFRNVCFSYASRSDLILNDLSFSIVPNQFNYIIGKSGSGKSTITNLIIQFYKHKTGSILIDGFDVQSLSHEWITNNITLIQQNPVIFNDTLRTNVAIAGLNKFDLSEVPDALIQDAIDFSMLRNDIELMENGVDEVLTSKSLSGGQQQRLSIARAYIRDTPILILDETFSALDNKNKDIIITNLKNWRKGKTTIIITHEYQYIEADDNVIELEFGQVKHGASFPEKSSVYKSELRARDLFDTIVEEEFETKSFHYLSDPAILKDLEKQLVDDSFKLMSIFAIVKYFVKTNDKTFLLVIGLVASLVLGVASPVFSFYFSKMLSIMVQAALGINVSRELLINSCILIAIITTDAVASYASSYLLGYVSEAWIVKLRKQVFAKLAEQDISFLTGEAKRIAELTALLMNDTRDLRVLAADFFSLLINLVTMLLMGIIWSLITGWKLALVGISFVPLFMLLTMLYSNLMSYYEYKYKESIAAVENHNHSTIMGMRSIYSLNLNNYFIDTYEYLISNVKLVAGKRGFTTGVGVSLSEAVSSCAFGACIYFGMTLVSKGEYTQAQLLQVVTLLTFTMANAASLLEGLPGIARGQRSGTLIVKLLDLKPSFVETEGTIRPTKLSTDPIIRFQELDFSYQSKHKPIFKRLSLSINRGETVAIVGQSGAGKSTIASILMRLYQVKDNSVFIENFDINTLDIDWVRDNISIVPQFASFFEGTIHENLVYGIPPNVRVSEDDIYEALDFANISDLVNSLPDKLYSRIGESATSSFSGGQMQRLSIARALIRKPKILIMDECTSNLDPENTRFIFDLIKRLHGKYTTILITHDPEMMAISSNMIVLKDGKVAEVGTFEKLLRSQGALTDILQCL